MTPVKYLMTTFLIIITALLAPFSLRGQVTAELEYRPRFEWRDGYRELLPSGASPSFIISQRLRMSVSYQTDGLKLKMTPQDVRVWGDDSLKNTTHFFGLAQTNSNTPGEKALGVENEMQLKYRFNERGTLKAGWLFYVPTDSFREMQGVENERFPHFAFMELAITPSLFED